MAGSGWRVAGGASRVAGGGRRFAANDSWQTIHGGLKPAAGTQNRLKPVEEVVYEVICGNDGRSLRRVETRRWHTKPAEAG
ncbi:protein of unknown function [Candidatus Promineifilum breve]|uniref:Uncharacterized protein n=1 Tax=Candidatus Promineifilum breve TaxID=1806508 RepID=A0A161KBA7_9CHLR|nr:protein of unknown function [Candidatus Promineifilum breve]